MAILSQDRQAAALEALVQLSQRTVEALERIADEISALPALLPAQVQGHKLKQEKAD